MIAWFLSSWMFEAVAIVFAIWFLNGIRKALWLPPVTYVSHSDVRDYGYLVRIKRQELLPPWRQLEETWRLDQYSDTNRWFVCREGDGRWDDETLARRIYAAFRVAQARTIESEEAERKLAEELERDLAKKRKLDDLIAQAEAK